MQPFPTQLTGASFLASRSAALLADEPRVGKTGTAIIAADYNMEEQILIVTTASGRAVWRRGLANWSVFQVPTQVIWKSDDKISPLVGRVIVSWGMISNPNIRKQLLSRRWDRVMLDEGHYAKNFETMRTQAAYGYYAEDAILWTNNSLASAADFNVWVLTGTPMPNAPNDLYPMMRALFPEALIQGFNVQDYDVFEDRYCRIGFKKVGNFRKVKVVVGGKNLEELGARLKPYMLLRKQSDVGIRPPVHDTMPLHVSAKVRKEVDASVDGKAVLSAALNGDTEKLKMEMPKLRRITGPIKAMAVAEALKEEFDCGLEKVVLAYWHKDTGNKLRELLAPYGVTGIDGSTPQKQRGENEELFLRDPNIRVWVGQIQASGEAVDLSSASDLIFVETSTIPKDMKQMSLRITNHTQANLPLVRVAVLEGSIDEALEEILLRKWSMIREVLK